MKSLSTTLLVISAIFAALSCNNASVSFDLDRHVGVSRSLDDAQAAFDAGADYMEINVQEYLVPEQDENAFLKSVEAFGHSPLPVYAGNCFFPGELKIIGPEADTPRAVEYALTAIRRAGRLGMKILVIGSGRSRDLPEGFSREEADRQFVELLSAIAPTAGECGVTIVIEPLNTGETAYINTVREGYEICSKVNHPNICVLADFFHMYKVGEGPDAIVYAADKLRHCHIAEGEHRTPPGVEKDDFSGYFNALRSIGYTGAISLECDWGDYDSVVRSAVEYTRNEIEKVK